MRSVKAMHTQNRNSCLIQREKSIFYGIFKTNDDNKNDFNFRAIISYGNNCIFYLGQKEGGTQLKLVIDYLNGDQALFKPMR